MNDRNHLSLASVFQSQMVIQRNKPVVIWGNAPENSTVTVEFCGLKEKAQVKNKEWKCTFPSQNAKKGCTLFVSCNGYGTRDIVLKDISIGDVWLACGQSNMEFFLCYDKDWETVKNFPKNPDIRMFNVPQNAYKGHNRNRQGYGAWFGEGDCGFETFSAPGYSFARNIQPAIGVPVGMIGCNWGGSTASAWLDEAYLKNSPLNVYMDEYEEALKLFSADTLKKLSMKAWDYEDSPEHIADFMPLMYGKDREWQINYMKRHANDPVLPMGPYHFNRPGGLYHQMLKPLTAFPVKGILWYQGESDAVHADIYETLLTSLIACWRKDWNEPLPFLFVQLAPFEKWLDCDAEGYPEIRHQQESVSKNVPGTAMASIMDIGCRYDIHPKEKMEVGRRLALLARGKVYGEDILCESPELENARREGDRIILTFKNSPSPLICKQEKKSFDSINGINGFQFIRELRPVPIKSIQIENNRIILQQQSPADSPCSIYFAWSNYVEVNIFNEAGLPVKPFRCEV